MEVRELVYLGSWNPLPMELPETSMTSSSLKRSVKSIDRLAGFEAVDSGEPELLQVPQRNCRRAEILLLQKDNQSYNYQDNYSV